MLKSIIVQSITKNYKIYKEPADRLKESLNPFQKKYHKKFSANNNISFEITKGEVVGIIGMNGSGKSTLLKMITGVLTPSSGNIKINGKITALLELGSSFNPEMSGLDNLYLSGSIYGISKTSFEDKINDIINFAEIGDFIYQPVKTYSSGMKARLGFAFAISIEPEILIIDEALSVGDAAFQRKCYAKIEDMCSSKSITVLFVSHSAGAIKQLCDRAILIHNGKLVLDGIPKNVINLYEKYMNGKNVDIEKLKQEYMQMLDEPKKDDKKTHLNSYYNPNLKSKSLVVREENGAKITNITLLDENEIPVNILVKHTKYTFRYTIVFSNNYDSVNVAMRIKNINGIIITGAAHTIEDVIQGKEYLISFSFTNILNNGEYFFNAGASCTLYGDFVMLHQVIDALMIKTGHNSQNDFSRGLVDFKIKGSYS